MLLTFWIDKNVLFRSLLKKSTQNAIEGMQSLQAKENKLATLSAIVPKNTMLQKKNQL